MMLEKYSSNYLTIILEQDSETIFNDAKTT